MIVNKQKGRKKIFFFNNQKGMALITVLIFVFVLVSFSIALLVMTSSDSKLSTLHRESTKAFYLAETGVDKALWYLNNPEDQGGNGIDWRTVDEDGITPVPVIYPSDTASEAYKFTVLTDPLSTGDLEIIVIKSFGRVTGGEYDKGTRVVVVKLEEGIAPSPGAVYNFAIMTFAEDSELTFNGHVEIEGDIHSNGDLTGNGWDPDDDVDGNVSYSGDETTITGDNVGPLGVQDFPAIDWKYYENHADQVYDTDTAYEIGNETLMGIHYFKGDVTIKNDLLVVGTLVVDGSITVSGNPDITLLPGAEISLVMISTGEITLNGNVHVEGIIHTEADITLNGTTNVEEGAILAEDGVINGTGASTKVVYNVENQELPVPGTGIAVWKIASWQEVQDVW